MVRYVMLVAALGVAAPSPSPAPTATPPLKVIAHVRASASCAEFATRANFAIDQANRNDGMLGDTIRTLQTVDLDGNVIKRHNGLNQLGEFAKTLNLQALAGDREIKRLREMGEKSTDPDKKKEFKAFADWLGGALWRQRKIARDLNGFLAAMDFHDMARPDESTLQMEHAIFDDPMTRSAGYGVYGPYGPGWMGGPPPLGFERMRDPNEPTDTEEARAAAADFELRLPAISNDEALAADHVIPAVDHC